MSLIAVFAVLFIVACAFLVMGDLFGEGWVGRGVASARKGVVTTVLVTYEMLKPVILTVAILAVVAGVAGFVNRVIL